MNCLTSKELRRMKNVPEIRFKGFEDEWERLVVSDLLQVNKTLNTDNRYGREDVLSVSDECGIVNQIKYLGRSYAGKSVLKYKVVKPNQIVYTKSPLKDKPYGIVKQSDIYGIVSSLYAVYDIIGNCIPSYIQWYFEPYYRINKYFRPLVNKGAKNTINISDTNAVTGTIYIPKIVEQTIISSYLEFLSKHINDTTKKIASLKQLKSACFISMFPQQGETEPRVRFKEFDGEWNEQKAENIFRQFIEKNRPDLPVLSATQDRGMVTRKAIGYDISHDKRNECTYKHILPGQFVIHLRSFQGGFAHSDIEGIASPAYTVFEFRDKNQHNDIFWKYIFSSKSFIKQLEKITYGIRDGRSISFDEFKDMKFIIPYVKEQHQIASYFRNLDIQISEQEKRLEKLKQIKAACLDKMFV